MPLAPGRCAPSAKRYARQPPGLRPSADPAALLATPRAALARCGCALRAGPASGRRARRRFAFGSRSRLRRARPAGPAPRLQSCRPCAGLRPPRSAAGSLGLPSASLCCGLPSLRSRSPLLRSASAVPFAPLAGASPGRPLRGFAPWGFGGGNGSGPGGRARPLAALFGGCAPGPYPRPLARPAGTRRPVAAVSSPDGLSPAPPPPRRPRWGLRGARGCRLGAAAPRAAPVPALPRPLLFCKQGLTSAPHCGTIFCAWLTPGAYALRTPVCPWVAESPVRKGGGFSMTASCRPARNFPRLTCGRFRPQLPLLRKGNLRESTILKELTPNFHLIPARTSVRMGLGRRGAKVPRSSQPRGTHFPHIPA